MSHTFFFKDTPLTCPWLSALVYSWSCLYPPHHFSRYLDNRMYLRAAPMSDKLDLFYFLHYCPVPLDFSSSLPGKLSSCCFYKFWRDILFLVMPLCCFIFSICWWWCLWCSMVHYVLDFFLYVLVLLDIFQRMRYQALELWLQQMEETKKMWSIEIFIWG